MQERLSLLPQARGVFQQVTGLWMFDEGGTVQRLQHRLKYGNVPTLAEALGRRLGRALAQDGVDRAYDAIVPVPLSPTRRLERGYNQSAFLAQGIAQAFGQPHIAAPDALVRTRRTRSQTSLSRADRWANVSGAFRVSSPQWEGRRVLLVDDVLTTGATLTAAAQALITQGARIDVAVFAVASI